MNEPHVEELLAPNAEAHRHQLLDPPHGQPLCRHPTPPLIAIAMAVV